MCLAQGHNAVKSVMLEPAAPRSRDKHYTTEPPEEWKIFWKFKTYKVKLSLGFTHLNLSNLL